MPLGARDLVVLDTLLPADADRGLPSILEVGVEGFYADFERAATPFMRMAFRTALFGATWLSPVLIGHLPPLGRHARDTRERALEAMAGSRITLFRDLLVVLKLVAALAYGADTRVRERIGYARERTV